MHESTDFYRHHDDLFPSAARHAAQRLLFPRAPAANAPLSSAYTGQPAFLLRQSLSSAVGLPLYF